MSLIVTRTFLVYFALLIGIPHFNNAEHFLFSQKLDHFNLVDTRFWRQRFWVNLEHFKPGGPALIMIGGEGEASPGWLGWGVWSEIAAENGAAMFVLEHRFYGKSAPTEDMSTANMKFLSSRQALEDLAGFITAMNSQYDITGIFCFIILL